MIKRSASKANMSLVNMAQEELLTVSGGIVTSTPVTNEKTVKYSNNFELDKDGSYILRKPLVLKETIPNKDTYYLYDRETKISFANGHINITGPETVYVKLKFFDINEKEFLIDYLNSYNFISELISVYNALDHTLLSVKINHETFINSVTKVQNSSIVPMAYLTQNISGYNPNLYRFIKIYKDYEIDENTWIIEIVHPEFNSITSSLGEEGVDFNMLLDNPYAIRDLYNYGYESATKILAYKPIGASPTANEIYQEYVFRLTESNPINGVGFKILENCNYDANEGNVVLKAFVTAKQRSNSETNNYYCCWERSEDGIDWEACPEFLTRFSSSYYVEKKVADLESVEFEKLLVSENLEKAISYLVTKKLVPANFYNQNVPMGMRPDILVVDSNALKYHYRFLVYFSSSKAPEDKRVDKITTKNYFTTANVDGTDTEIPYLDADGKYIQYKTNTGYGVDDPSNSNSPSKSPELENGLIILCPGKKINDITYSGNSLSIIPNQHENVHLKKITITLADKVRQVDNDGKLIDYTQTTSVLGYSIGFKNDYGVYGGLLVRVAGIWTLYYNNMSPAFIEWMDREGLAENPDFDGVYPDDDNSFVRLHNSEYGTNNWPTQSGNQINFGYKQVAGFFFKYDGVTDNPCHVATITGWEDKPDPVISIDKFTELNIHSTVNDLTNVKEVAASKQYVIDLSTYNESNINISELAIFCATTSQYVSDANEHLTRIESIKIEYDIPLVNETTTTTYLSSSAGPYKIPYNKETTVVADIYKQRQNLFYGEMYFDKGAYKFFAKDKVYYTDPNAFIIKMLNVLDFSTTVTKVLQYRDYLVVFTSKDISLVHENSDGTYSTKIISNSVGLPKADAKTVAVILNSIYFKSETKVYKLVPNLYASTEDVIDIKLVSTSIDDLFTHVVNRTFETSNFAYSDIDTYRIFIPNSNSLTYCFVYDLERKAWTLLTYPVALSRLEVNTIGTSYVVKETTSENYTECGIYHFKDDIETLLEEIRLQDFSRIGAKSVDGDEYLDIKVKYIDDYGIDIIRPVVYGNSTYSYIDADAVYAKIPYGDYLLKTPLMLYSAINDEAINLINNGDIDFDDFNIAPMSFNIDFGQKSSNYTMDKQFLETKFIFATLHPKDLFPVTVDISTDGIQKPLHWDCNTDSAFWKDSLNYIGTLNTFFQEESSDYDGILRQLIIKYSGKGKTVRHTISGISRYRFKFISLLSRFRILPKKQ